MKTPFGRDGPGNRLFFLCKMAGKRLWRTGKEDPTHKKAATAFTGSRFSFKQLLFCIVVFTNKRS
jgi:hypothetical protein